MKFQDERYADMDRKELLELEAQIHDDEYRGTGVFGSDGLIVHLDDFWRKHRRPFYKGVYIRGYRKRRLFELIGLEDIEGKKVLDVSCGIGQHAVLCTLHGANVVGFDISEVAIDRAQTIANINDVGETCTFHQQSVDNLRYDSEEFEIVLCNAVLHHIWKYEGALDELHRVLAPGGRLYFAEGLRSNSVYRIGRKIKRAWTGEEVKGDVDLEFKDMVTYAERFDDYYCECYTIVSGVKNVIAGDYGSSVFVRLVLLVTEAIDSLLLKIPGIERWALEIVGYMQKSVGGGTDEGKSDG